MRSTRRWSTAAAALAGALLLAVGCGGDRDAGRTFQESLFDRFDAAERRGVPSERTEIQVGGASRRVIVAHPPTRLTWTKRVPANAWVSTAAGLKPGAAMLPGGAVLFRVAITDGRIHEILYSSELTAASLGAAPQPVSIDLGGFAGWQWSLFYRPGERDWRLMLTTSIAPSAAPDAAASPYWVDPVIAWRRF